MNIFFNEEEGHLTGLGAIVLAAGIMFSGGLITVVAVVVVVYIDMIWITVCGVLLFASLVLTAFGYAVYCFVFRREEIQQVVNEEGYGAGCGCAAFGLGALIELQRTLSRGRR